LKIQFKGLHLSFQTLKIKEIQFFEINLDHQRFDHQ